MGEMGWKLLTSKRITIYCSSQRNNRHIKKFCQIDETSPRPLEREEA